MRDSGGTRAAKAESQEGAEAGKEEGGRQPQGKEKPVISGNRSRRMLTATKSTGTTKEPMGTEGM